MPCIGKTPVLKYEFPRQKRHFIAGGDMWAERGAASRGLGGRVVARYCWEMPMYSTLRLTVKTVNRFLWMRGFEQLGVSQ